MDAPDSLSMLKKQDDMNEDDVDDDQDEHNLWEDEDLSIS